MDVVAAFGLGLVGIFFGVWFVLSFTRWFQVRQLDYYSHQAGLAVPDELEARIGGWVVALERSTAGGGLAGALVAFGILWILPKPDYSAGSAIDVSGAVILVTIFLGSMITRSVTAMALTIRPRVGPRIARSTTPRLTDYVPTVELAATGSAVGWAAGLLILSRLAVHFGILHSASLDDTNELFGSVGAMYAYLAVATALVGAVLVKTVLRAPQQAGSKPELAWHDALRATTLRTVIGLPMVWGLSSIYLNFLDLGIGSSWHPGVLGIIAAAVFVVTAAVAITLGILDHKSRPDEYFLKRLWNDAELVPR